MHVDELLKEFFNDYLKLPVFPEQPADIKNKYIIPYTADDEEINLDSTFTLRHRLPYFKYSKHFREYKFFRIILNRHPEKNSDRISVKENVSLPPITKRQSFPDYCSIDLEEQQSLLPKRSTSVLEFSALQNDTPMQCYSPEQQDEFIKSCMGDISSMQQFIHFLSNNNNSGYILVVIWMNIERWKDVFALNKMSRHCSIVKETKMNVFRLIQEKFQNRLSVCAKKLIHSAVSNDDLSLEIFQQTQLDIMERLKSYWLPRYFLHYQTLNEYSDKSYENIRCTTSMGIFPSVSFVKSLPFYCEDLNSKAFKDVNQFNNERWKSATVKAENTRDPVLSALKVDKDAGYPFSSWLTAKYPSFDYVIHFWLDINDYLSSFYLLNDRTLKLCSLWKIFHNYMQEETELASSEEILQLRSSLKLLKDLSKENILKLFTKTMRKALSMISCYWIEYCESDELNLANCHRLPDSISPCHSIVLQKREELISGSLQKMSISSNVSQKSKAVKTKKVAVTNTRQADLEVVEDKTTSSSEEEEEPEDDDDFLNHVDNTSKISQFKNYIEKEESRLSMNDLLMYLEIEMYFSLGKVKQFQKQQTSMMIYKTFFNPSSRKSASLPDTLLNVVKDECPTSTILLDAQQYVLPQLSQSFRNFCESDKKNLRHHSVPANDEKNEISKSKVDVKLTKSEKRESKFSELGNRIVDKVKKRKGSGRATVLKQDRKSFIALLSNSSSTSMPKLDIFTRYLSKYEGRGFPRLTKDLLFCVEVMKFKDLYHYMDEVALLRKIGAIIDVFLDSASPPWLQVDIPHELASKITQKYQQSCSSYRPSHTFYLMKDFLTIFDPAYAILLKELLPFWSGYQKQHVSKQWNDIAVKLTKAERRQKRLYKEFNDFIPPSEPMQVQISTPADLNLLPQKRTLNFSIKNGCHWKDGITSDEKHKWKTRKSVQIAADCL